MPAQVYPNHPLGLTPFSGARSLDLYGPVETEAAIAEVVKSGGSHCSDVGQVLERRRRRAGLLSPVAIRLPDDKRINNL